MDASMAPNDRVPEEFIVKLKANNGYSNQPPAAKFAKKGLPRYMLDQRTIYRIKIGILEFFLENDDRRGKPSPRIPLVVSVKETFELIAKPGG
jgi:hypothetical protein